MKTSFDPILRLFRLVREQREEDLTSEMPPGFSLRVLAQIDEVLPETPWGRFALASLPLAATAAVCTFLLPPLLPDRNPEPEEYRLAQRIIQSVLIP